MTGNGPGLDWSWSWSWTGLGMFQRGMILDDRTAANGDDGDKMSAVVIVSTSYVCRLMLAVTSDLAIGRLRDAGYDGDGDGENDDDDDDDARRTCTETDVFE